VCGKSGQKQEDGFPIRQTIADEAVFLFHFAIR
jgi:hypothetical protein